MQSNTTYHMTIYTDGLLLSLTHTQPPPPFWHKLRTHLSGFHNELLLLWANNGNGRLPVVLDMGEMGVNVHPIITHIHAEKKERQKNCGLPSCLWTPSFWLSIRQSVSFSGSSLPVNTSRYSKTAGPFRKPTQKVVGMVAAGCKSLTISNMWREMAR